MKLPLRDTVRGKVKFVHHLRDDKGDPIESTDQSYSTRTVDIYWEFLTYGAVKERPIIAPDNQAALVSLPDEIAIAGEAAPPYKE